MTGAPSLLAGLLAECEAHGIRLSLADDDGLEIDAPQNALTPDVLARLKESKAELLELLRSAAEPAALPAPEPAIEYPATPVCRCGSTSYLDFPIHGGRSVRRDCAACRRFIDFPIWYGTRLTA